MDREINELLLETMESIKAYSEQHAARREKRLWKEVNLPGSLTDLIGRLTKDEMNIICKSYDFKSTSSLKKADLAARLVELVPVHFPRVLYTLDKGRYGLVKALVSHSGMVKGEVQTYKAEALLGSCIAFPCTYNNERALYMPQELIDVFLNIDGPEFKKVVERNTEWIMLTHGMLYYYGVMGINKLLGKIEKYTGNKVDLLEFIEVLTPAIEYHGQVHYSNFGLRDDRVCDPEKIANEHKTRPKIDYYPFTKEQLYKAGNIGYIDRTPAMNTFLSFISDCYDLSNEELDEIGSQLIYMINMDSRPNDIITFLESRLEFPSFEFVHKLTEKIIELFNNTRQWALKGHTPHELFQDEKKSLKPISADPFLLDQKQPKVVDIKNGKKYGRNDPCPCGSGKKFKKCCGG